MLLISPAKINLHLAALNKRADGFHEIESIFQTINLVDKIWLKPCKAPEFRFFLHKNSKIPGQTKDYNLYDDHQFFKIFKRLKEKWNLPFSGIEICLQKNIPIGAGLGGGSSNMAAYLLGLYALKSLLNTKNAQQSGHKKTSAFSKHSGQQFAFTRFSKEERVKLVFEAEKLGSDVPFFLYGGLALVGGRGELVNPLPFSLTNNALLLFPPLHISSGRAYNESLTLGRFLAPYRASKTKAGYIVALLKSLLITYGEMKDTLHKTLYILESEDEMQQIKVKKEKLRIKEQKTVMKVVLKNFLHAGNISTDKSLKKIFSPLNEASKVNGVEVAGNAFFEKTVKEQPLIKKGYEKIGNWIEKNNQSILIHGLSGSGSTLFWVFHGKLWNKQNAVNGAKSLLLANLNKSIESKHNNAKKVAGEGGIASVDGRQFSIKEVKLGDYSVKGYI